MFWYIVDLCDGYCMFSLYFCCYQKRGNIVKAEFKIVAETHEL
jgi:hypothetical protein